MEQFSVQWAGKDLFLTIVHSYQKDQGIKTWKDGDFTGFNRIPLGQKYFFMIPHHYQMPKKYLFFWKRQITRYPFDLFVSPGKIDFVCPLLDYRLLSSRFMKSITAPDSSVNFLKNKKFRKTMGLEPINWSGSYRASIIIFIFSESPWKDSEPNS